MRSVVFIKKVCVQIISALYYTIIIHIFIIQH